MSVTKHPFTVNPFKGIEIVKTATAGTVIHTGVSGQGGGAFDEVWLYASNTWTGQTDLTVEWGGAASPDDLSIITLPPKAGRIMLADGKLLQNGDVLAAFATTASVVSVDGFVNRIIND